MILWKDRLRASGIHFGASLARRDPDTMAYVPMAGRKAFRTAFIDPATAEVVAFLPLDPF